MQYKLIAVVFLLIAIPGVGSRAAAAPASSLFGRNLVVNPGAELGPASSNGSLQVAIPGWSRVGVTPMMNVVAYGYDGFPAVNSPGPKDRGLKLFTGGYNTLGAGAQQINVAPLAAAIDNGKASFVFSAFIGGWDGQSDYATAELKFLPGGTTRVLGPVTTLQRAGVTGLWNRGAKGFVPKGTRAARITLRMFRFSGSSNDGYIDNVSLILKKS